MGLYKLCEHKGRAQDRCKHTWWGAFQYQGKLHRKSLAQWANTEIRTKAQAQAVFERMKEAIRSGDLQKHDVHSNLGPLTFAKFADIYAEKHARAKGLALAKTIDYRLKPLIDYFGPRRLVDIKTADVEDFIAELRKPRRVSRQTGRKLKPASINRHLELLRHMFNWAIGREYIDRTPFRRGSETLVRPLLEDNGRRRRVSAEEEQRLLSGAPAILRALLVAALDTGMRRGEMLALRFSDIDWRHRLIVLRGPTTKSGRTRVVPIGTQRLIAVLEWLRLDADGQRKPDDAFVFSNGVGEPVKNFRSAWLTTVLKAHGVTPHWRRAANYRQLTEDCVGAFQLIDLHWHDLRHEYASRLVERGIPLAQVRDLLGHASITTTERYDNQRLETLQAAAESLEDGLRFDPAGPPGRTNFQESFKIEPQDGVTDPPPRTVGSEANSNRGADLEKWLGGRDSNPDYTVQSRVSYH